jgi:hypothetical protein
MTEVPLHLDHWKLWVSGTLNVLTSLADALEGDIIAATVYLLCMEEVLLNCPPETKAVEFTSRRYSVRAMGARLRLPKSTVYDKIHKLERLGFVIADKGYLSISAGDDGNPKLLERYPDLRHDIETMLTRIKTSDSIVVKR